MTRAIGVYKRCAKWVLLGLALLAMSSAAAEDIGSPTGSTREDDADPRSAAALTLAQRIALCGTDPRVALNLVSVDVCVGADLFFNEPFGGNGRTCGTCHPPTNNFTIDPTFTRNMPANDLLFAAAVPGLEIPQLLRDHALILENVDGLQAPTTKFVMRSVPHTFSLGASIVPVVGNGDLTEIPQSRFPAQRTGWSGDGAPDAGALRDFQTGAIIQHYTRSLARVEGADFVRATSDELARIVAFMGTIGRSNELNLASMLLNDANAEAGRTVFLSAAARCNGCHSNAGANIAAGTNRNFNTGVETARIATLNALNIPRDGGFGNRQLNADGSIGNGSFNTPPLIEAADTAPFFHTNAFNTIEDAIRFYTTSAFAQSPAGNPPIVLNNTQIANLGRFLRTLNVAFNCQLAMRRLQAAITIMNSPTNTRRSVENELMELALAEMNDAIDLLSPFALFYLQQRIQLTTARGLLQSAINNTLAPLRLQFAQQVLGLVTGANSSLGTGLTMNMGQGTLMGSLPLPRP